MDAERNKKKSRIKNAREGRAKQRAESHRQRNLAAANAPEGLDDVFTRGTVTAALCVSSATCAATSYPLSVHVALRKVMQNAQPVGHPVWL